MSEVIETTVYQFDELADEAKERARSWFREGRDSTDLEFVVEDFGRVCDLLGISLDTHEVRLMGGGVRYDPNVWYQLGYTQSDFAAFDGSYSYRTRSAKKVREYAPQDDKLHRIADALQAVQARYAYALQATVKHHHYYRLTVEVQSAHGREVTDTDESEIKEAIRDLAAWLYDLLRQEDEYHDADEQVDDSIMANEYTFTAEGERFG